MPIQKFNLYGSISKINILAKPEKKGYARQNGLTPGNYITIEFGGDVPAIFNGQITDLEQDMIELTIYESGEKIKIPNYERAMLKPGDMIQGQCVITEDQTTIVVSNNFNTKVLSNNFLQMEHINDE